jgi:hypothetical protein
LTGHLKRNRFVIHAEKSGQSGWRADVSKKLENFEAAVALHFASYNFVKFHNTLRCTPAMASAVERSPWTVSALVDAVEWL